MGNSLVFFCPQCGHEGQMNVLETDPHVVALRVEGGEKIIKNRTRVRRCGRCKAHFQTTEMSQDDVLDLYDRAKLAEILIASAKSRRQLLSFDHPTRIESMKCLTVIASVFGGRVSDLFREVYPLDEEECLAISDCTLAEIRSLEEEFAKAIRVHFGVFQKYEDGGEAVARETLERAIRKLKHPSRSRRLRRFADLVQ